MKEIKEVFIEIGKCKESLIWVARDLVENEEFLKFFRELKESPRDVTSKDEALIALQQEVDLVKKLTHYFKEFVVLNDRFLRMMGDVVLDKIKELIETHSIALYVDILSTMPDKESEVEEKVFSSNFIEVFIQRLRVSQDKEFRKIMELLHKEGEGNSSGENRGDITVH